MEGVPVFLKSSCTGPVSQAGAALLWLFPAVFQAEPWGSEQGGLEQGGLQPTGLGCPAEPAPQQGPVSQGC